MRLSKSDFLTRMAWQSAISVHRASPPLEFLQATRIEDVHRYFESRRDAVDPAVPADGIIHASCYVCGPKSEFEVSMSAGTVNWRETLRCRGCGLINRWRSCFHLFEQICNPTSTTSVYITEAVTPLHDLIHHRYPETTGSEFKPTIPSGEVVSVGDRPVLIQDVTRLSFPTDSFDCVLSFDVLEHLPDYRAAIREFARVLRGRGKLLLSAPFTFDASTVIRAILEPDGSVQHVLPAEYHGDPLSGAGVLCYQSFGMDLLTDLADSGFDSGCLCCYASPEWAYLGANVLFLAQKH